MRPMTRPIDRRRLQLALCLATAAILAMSAPVAAAMYDSGTFEGSEVFAYDDCGFHVDGTSTSGGRYYNRIGAGPDAGAFFSHTKFWFREVHVPTNGGRTLVVEGNQLFQETRGTRIEGNIFEFEARVPGTITVSTLDGRVIQRDAGTIKQVYRVDTLGDDTPGGVDFEWISYSWAGPHPGETSDWCSLFG